MQQQQQQHLLAIKQNQYLQCITIGETIIAMQLLRIISHRVVIKAVRTSAIQYCNTSFLQLLQVACKFSASCRKLVLQRCIAGVRTSAIQLQYEKKILVLQYYCSCIALVRTA